MSRALRDTVFIRANGRCEYCLLPQELITIAHHLDHILATKHGGSNELKNLALSCSRCSLSKSANLASIDPETGKLVRLFHPRKDRWTDHFEWDGPYLVGKTAIGRATLNCLNINLPDRIESREIFQAAGIYPQSPSDD